MAGIWHVYPKWMRWLPLAIFVRLYTKRYKAALIYDEGDQSFSLDCHDPLFYSKQPLLDRIVYLEGVISKHADLIIQNACKE